MKITKFKTLAKLIRSNDTYKVYDYRKLKNIVVSTTELHREKETKGHSHDDADEVYICLQGSGELELDGVKEDFIEGEFYIIPRGVFHKVYNVGGLDLIFLCIFEKYGERK